MKGILGKLPAWKPGEDFVPKLYFALRSVGRELPGILSILLRLGLILLFFWYLAALVLLLWTPHTVLAFTAGAAGLAMACAFFRIGYRAFHRFDARTDDVPDGIGPFLCLNLLPVLAIALAVWRKIPLGAGLPGLTAEVLKKLGSLVGL